MSNRRNQTVGRVYSREQMRAALERSYPKAFIRDSENFDKHYKDGLWMNAEQGITDRKGKEIFNYYGTTGYTGGVVNHFNDWAVRHGWYFEYLDPGTVMLWRDE